MAAKRSQPTHRDEGKANVIAATLRLLDTTAPKDITLRDIARESGHGNRLIIEWFGGKGGLFGAVFERIFAELRESGQLFAADIPVRDETKKVFGLFSYMKLMHPEETAQLRSGLIDTAVRERMQNALGMSAEQADLAVRRLSVVTLGAAVFADFFGLSGDEVIRLMQDEFRTSTGAELPTTREPLS